MTLIYQVILQVQALRLQVLVSKIASSQKSIIRCLVMVSSKKYRLGITANVIRLMRRAALRISLGYRVYENLYSDRFS